MAKFNHGIFTKTKGKLGGVVFQQYEGLQIGKEYQPNVKNPNTSDQIARRAIFSLCSKVNALCYPFLTALQKANGITYTRFQRGDSLKKFISQANFDTANNVAVIAKLPEFRNSFNTMSAITGAANIGADDEIELVINTDSTAAHKSVFGIAILIPHNGGAPTVRYDEQLNIQLGTATLAFGDIPTGFHGTINLIAFMTEEATSLTSVRYGDIINGSTAQADGIASADIERFLGTSVNVSNSFQISIWRA